MPATTGRGLPFPHGRGGGPAAQVQANVNRFLAEIRRIRHWSVDASAGVAPDSNINAATVVKTVTLFGVPFQLDQNAQKSSGIGFVGGLGGSYQFDIDDDRRLIVGGNLRDLDYAGNRFDDRTVGTFVGPRFLLGTDSEVAVKAVANRRWYGGLSYTWGLGGRVEAETTLSNDVLVNGWLDVEQVTYDQIPLNSGPVAASGGAVTYGLDQVSFVRFDMSITREQTKDFVFRDTQYSFGPSYYRDVPWGFGLLIGASADVALYDQSSDAFGVTRHDHAFSYRLGISNKQINLFGITPVITYTHTDRYSNIALYAYGRDRAEISMSRNF